VQVNPVEPSLAQAGPVFQKWNPLFVPSPETVLAAVKLQRAVVEVESEQALVDLGFQPGRGRTGARVGGCVRIGHARSARMLGWRARADVEPSLHRTSTHSTMTSTPAHRRDSPPGSSA